MIVAVIPVKRLDEAKSRLAGSLSEGERAELALRMVERTVAVLRDSGLINRLALTTPDPDLTRRLAVEWLPDAGTLNASLNAGARWAIGLGATSLLVLPTDLPLIKPRDLRALLDAAPPPPSVTVAPTRDGGTGAIVLRPPDVVSLRFGPGSASRHLAAATTAGARGTLVSLPAFAQDLDTPADLRDLRARLPPSQSRCR